MSGFRFPPLTQRVAKQAIHTLTELGLMEAPEPWDELELEEGAELDAITLNVWVNAAYELGLRDAYAMERDVEDAEEEEEEEEEELRLLNTIDRANAASVAIALFGAFDWNGQVEGYDYWSDVYDHLMELADGSDPRDEPYWQDQSLSTNLASAFTWPMTPQGYDYWYDVHERLRRIEGWGR